MSDYAPFSGDGHRREPPSPVLIERLWRLRSAQSGKILSCGLYLHPRGVEARCGYRDEVDLLMSIVEKTPDAAKVIADEWRQHALDKGFEALSCPSA